MRVTRHKKPEQIGHASFLRQCGVWMQPGINYVADKTYQFIFDISNSSNSDIDISILQQDANSEWQTLAFTSVSRDTKIELDALSINNTPMKVKFGATDITMNLGGLALKRVDKFVGNNIVQISSKDLDFDDDYRFGFNGQHKENEIAGIGNHNTALFWEYDTRLGRRWNVDPVVKPWRSSYDAFANNPIILVDPNGDDDYYNEKGKYLYTDSRVTNKIRIIAQEDFNKIRIKHAPFTGIIAPGSLSKKSDLGLLKDLTFNSKVAKINIKSEMLTKMWEDSHPEKNIGDGRKEQDALITLDLRDKNNPQINFEVQDDTHNDADGSYDYATQGADGNWYYNDQLVIGDLHTHPNTNSTHSTDVNSQSADSRFAKNRGYSVYNLYGKNNGNRIDRNHHSGKTKNKTNVSSSTDGDKLGKDALETFGGKK